MYRSLLVVFSISVAFLFQSCTERDPAQSDKGEDTTNDPTDSLDNPAEDGSSQTGDTVVNQDINLSDQTDSPMPDGTDDTGTPGDLVEASDESSEDSAGDGSADPDTETHTEMSFTLDMAVFTLAPGEEITKCVNLALPNDTPVYVHEMTTTLAAGSHHLIVYRSVEEETQEVPETCFPFAETLSMSSAPLIISQIMGETLTFPSGVGITFQANQMIRMEAHFINYTGEELQASASVTFTTMPESAVEAVADMLFYGDLDIGIPGFSDYTVGPTWLPVDEGTKIFGITGHTHKYGTDVTLWKGPANEPGEAVYSFDDYDWDEPPVSFYDPPLSFQAGEGLTIQCSYENPTAKGIGFGESADDEMCFAWAYYYPANGFQICASHPLLKEYVGIEILCCPEDALCDLLLGFAGSL